MTTRVTEGARRERHDKRETARKARENTGSRGDVFVVRTAKPGRRKPLKKWVILIALQFRYTFYRLQTKRLWAPKIGLQYPLSFLPCPFWRRGVRQRGYGLRLLIFKSRSGLDKKRGNRLQ